MKLSKKGLLITSIFAAGGLIIGAVLRKHRPKLKIKVHKPLVYHALTKVDEKEKKVKISILENEEAEGKMADAVNITDKLVKKGQLVKVRKKRGTAVYEIIEVIENRKGDFVLAGPVMLQFNGKIYAKIKAVHCTYIYTYERNTETQRIYHCIKGKWKEVPKKVCSHVHTKYNNTKMWHCYKKGKFDKRWRPVPRQHCKFVLTIDGIMYHCEKIRGKFKWNEVKIEKSIGKHVKTNVGEMWLADKDGWKSVPVSSGTVIETIEGKKWRARGERWVSV